MELHLAIELAERRTICLAATHGVEIELDRTLWCKAAAGAM